jgi:hypothetical protein
MLNDKDFLATGGIISIQPDIFENPENNNEVIPTIVINQQWCFEEYSNSIEWWFKNINITSRTESGEKLISFDIQRDSSKYGESPEKRISEFVVTKFIKEWIEEALNAGYIQVVYCKCYLSIDFMDKEKLSNEQISPIPREIPLDFANCERTYLITHMDISGKIDLTDEIKKELNRII